MSLVSVGLNRAYGTVLRRIISNSTSNRIKAFFMGMSVATILQSSTATNLIVSSFSARKIITIQAALAVVLGADVGTTIAAQIMSLNVNWLMPILIISGYVINKVMNENQYKHVGRALLGVGLALLALKTITMVAEPLKNSEALQALTMSLSNQPVLAVIISSLLTWVVHSSLGMVLLYTSFVAIGTLPPELGLYMVLGANIGGALAPVAMTLRDNPAGRRVPLGNLLIRGVGALLVMIFMKNFVLPFIEGMHPNPARMLVNFHTAFNLTLAILFLPFIGPMTRLSELILPDRPRDQDESLPRYLDPAAIDTPAAALAGAARETLRVGDIIEKMLKDTLEALRDNNARLVHAIREQELIVDTLYDSIKTYLARLSNLTLDQDENRRYMQILTFSTNLEHIGDIIDKNLMDLAMKKIRNQDNFSRQGFLEISDLHARVLENMHLAQNIFMTNDIKMARKLFEEKAVLRSQEMHAAESHFQRLREGVAETIATSSLHLDILRDLRRINSHITLIAYPILEDAKELNPRLLKPTRLGKTKGGKYKMPEPPPPEKF